MLISKPIHGYCADANARAFVFPQENIMFSVVNRYQEFVGIRGNKNIIHSKLSKKDWRAFFSGNYSIYGESNNLLFQIKSSVLWWWVVVDRDEFCFDAGPLYNYERIKFKLTEKSAEIFYSEYSTETTLALVYSAWLLLLRHWTDA